MRKPGENGKNPGRKAEAPASDMEATRHFVARWRHFVLFMNPGQTVGQGHAPVPI